MTSKGRDLSLNRVGLALTEEASASTTLETILRLAAGYQGEVAGVYIEDTDILRAAALPFALEVCSATNVARPIESAEIERGMKDSAATLRKVIADTAKRSGTKCSFEVKRQNRARAVLEIAQGKDVTLFTAAATYKRRAYDITRRGEASASEPIVAVVDHRAASRRAMQLASALAAEHGLPIRVLIVAASDAGFARLTEQVQRDTALQVSEMTALNNPSFSEIVRAAVLQNPSSLVMPLHLAAGPDQIRALDEALDSPIVVVK